MQTWWSKRTRRPREFSMKNFPFIDGSIHTQPIYRNIGYVLAKNPTFTSIFLAGSMRSFQRASGTGALPQRYVRLGKRFLGRAHFPDGNEEENFEARCNSVTPVCGPLFRRRLE